MRKRIYGQPQQRRSYDSGGRQDVGTACEARWTLRNTVLIDRFRAHYPSRRDTASKNDRATRFISNCCTVCKPSNS